MYIYKVTNKINGKVYIGQTIKTIEERWRQHQNAALKHDCQTHFARALRKYGIENFTIEQIDSVTSRNELDEKEIYWIQYYNSFKDGYNSTRGGQHYSSHEKKTDEELAAIKEKLRDSKLGGKNPRAIKVKCRNEKTGEEYHFDSTSEMQEFFGDKNHNFITRRCLGKTKCLYRKEWNITYEDQEYPVLTPNKNNRKARKVQVTDSKDNITKIFPSYAEAERFFNVPLKTFSGKAYRYSSGHFIIKDRYEIQVLD